MSAGKLVCSPHILRVKVGLAAATPLLALAAQHTMRVSPLESISVLTWCFIIVFALIGWAAADVDKVAELWNVGDGSKYQQILARLKLLKTIIGSLAAGIFTYFIGKVAPGPLVSLMGLKFEEGQPPEIHEFVLLILVAGAGWLGSRWFERAFGAR